MSTPDLLAALRPVLDTLDDLAVPHYVGGSIASSAHGIARSSIDADLLADLRPEHVEGLLAALSGADYIPEARVRDAVLRRTFFNLIHLETMLKIDVFVSRGRPFDRRALERARPAPAGSQSGRMPIASAEDMIVIKLEWYRRGGEVSERQWGDVLGMLRVGAACLDFGYLEESAKELAVVDLLHRALRDSGAA